jgi:cytochrome c oxidase cbb3-type subunit 4
MDYHLFREIADSWVLIALFGFFLAAVLWAWRPGSRGEQEEASRVPFRNDDRPAPDGETPR